MKAIVLDTNIVVGAIITPGRICWQIVEMVVGRQLEIVVDDRILDEYRSVLLRHEFSMSATDVSDFLEFAQVEGRRVMPPVSSDPLPDETDRPFIECAIAGQADYIVTGNKRHFPARACHGIPVLSPAEFLEAIKRS